MTAVPRLDDAETLALARRTLFSAVIGDVMDVIGLKHQFLPPAIRPMRADMLIVGRAMTVTEADVPDADDAEPPAAFGLMFDALDDLKPGEVYICTGASPTYALWGELMTVRAQTLGAAGAILDGYARDTRGLLERDLPVFSHGSYAQDQGVRGHVTDFRQPIRFANGVVVASGDMVFADLDGVVVVPRSAEREVLARATEKVLGENKVREALENGMGARDAFTTFGIM